MTGNNTGTVYALTLESEEFCGVYDDEQSLCKSFSNLKSFIAPKSLKAKKLLVGSNIVINELSHEDLDAMTDNIIKRIRTPCSHSKQPAKIVEEPPKSNNSNEVTITIPVEIRSEVMKVKERYSMFVENMTTFRRLLEDGVVHLGMKPSMVPELFRDRFHIFRDIIINKVTDEYAFGYFMDRYIPSDVMMSDSRASSFLLETINESSDDDDEDDKSSSSSSSYDEEDSGEEENQATTE